MTRFFINIGRKDSLNPARLIGLINDQKITDNIEIGAIDILDTFSFFEIDKKFEEQTLNSFSENQPEFSGRGVNIEITKKERGGGRRRGGKNHLVIKMVVVLVDVEVQKNHLEVEEVKTTIRIKVLADEAVIDQTETLTMTESHLALEEKEEKEDNFYKKISSEY